MLLQRSLKPGEQLRYLTQAPRSFSGHNISPWLPLNTTFPQKITESLHNDTAGLLGAVCRGRDEATGVRCSQSRWSDCRSNLARGHNACLCIQPLVSQHPVGSPSSISEVCTPASCQATSATLYSALQAAFRSQPVAECHNSDLKDRNAAEAGALCWHLPSSRALSCFVSHTVNIPSKT